MIAADLSIHAHAQPMLNAPHVTIAYRARPAIDAIDAYSRRLACELGRSGIVVTYDPTGLPLTSGGPPGSAVLLQYNPFSWGRSGFCPRIVGEAARVRKRRTRLVLMIHEAWIDITTPKAALIGGWQRAQLRALLALANDIVVSTEALADLFGPKALHLPPAATIEPIRTTPEEAKYALGLDGDFVLTLFGRGHPSRALRYAEAAIDAVAQRAGSNAITVLNLGAGAPVVRVPQFVKQWAPGALTAEDLSLHLHASDLVLLPFEDGLSTRRTTLMASLAHGLPVLGLAGPRTDRLLLRAVDSLVLTTLGDISGFAAAATALCASPERRTSIGASGRAFYTRVFDWPVLASRLLALLTERSRTPPKNTVVRTR